VWSISEADFYYWFGLPVSSDVNCDLSPLSLTSADETGQRHFHGTSCASRWRKAPVVHQPCAVHHPWQCDPPLPSNVSIDVSNHLPHRIPCPAGWEVTRRNGRVLITPAGAGSFGMDYAQYELLLALYHSWQLGRVMSPTQWDSNTQPVPATEHFLRTLRMACAAQVQADLNYQVHWSRHLLACLRQITGAELLVGASAVNYNPHFSYFFSPNPHDACFGTMGARLCASLNAKSLVLHRSGCWQDAAWDAHPSRYAVLLWKLGVKERHVLTSPFLVQPKLGR